MAKFGPFRIPRDFNEVWGFIRDIAAGLVHLTFQENFDSFMSTQTIAAGAEVSLRNEFRDGRIPTHWLIVDATGGNQITRGTTAWSSTYLTLKNNGAASATITVRFFR